MVPNFLSTFNFKFENERNFKSLSLKMTKLEGVDKVANAQ